MLAFFVVTSRVQFCLIFNYFDFKEATKTKGSCKFSIRLAKFETDQDYILFVLEAHHRDDRSIHSVLSDSC